MMRGKLLGTFLGIALLLLSVALAARGAAPVAATPLPTIATPKTAHVALDLTIGGGPTSNESFTFSASGAGDIDTARQAMQFAYTLQLPAEPGGAAQASKSITAELIVVDGRIYMSDPTTKQWTWLAAPASGATGAFFAPDFADFRGTPPDFTRVGPELLNGAATTRWRATLNLADLLFADPGLAAAPSATPLPEMALTLDYWIGDADSYAHRIAMNLTFAAPAAEVPGGDFTLAMALTYSKFDQPVQIVAPAGATPAASGDGPAATDGGFLTASALPFNASTLPLPGGIGGIAGAFSGAGGAATGSGGVTIGRPAAANPSPTARRGTTSGVLVGTPVPTSVVAPAAMSPTATRLATAPPTATVAIVANAAIPPTVAPQAQVVAPTTAQEPPRAPAGRSNALPLALGTAGIVLLLGFSGGLIVAGRRSSGR